LSWLFNFYFSLLPVMCINTEGHEGSSFVRPSLSTTESHWATLLRTAICWCQSAKGRNVAFLKLVFKNVSVSKCQCQSVSMENF